MSDCKYCHGLGQVIAPCVDCKCTGGAPMDECRECGGKRSFPALDYDDPVVGYRGTGFIMIPCSVCNGGSSSDGDSSSE